MSLDLENINLGATAGDKTGDGARTGGGKINRNFERIKTFLETPDAILVQTGYELVGQNLTFNSGWKWRIATVEYTNPADVVINFPLAASGKSRLDVVVLTTSNTFLRVVGAESTSTPVAPATPSGSLYVTVVLVTDGVVNQPEQPEVNGAYVQKSERANVVLTGSGIINQLDLVDEKATIVFKGSVTRLNTVTYNSIPYNGKRITLFNAQTTPLTISHAVSGFGVDFIFPDGQDYALQPNQTIEFSFDMTYFPYAHHMFIGGRFQLTEESFSKNLIPQLDINSVSSVHALSPFVTPTYDGSGQSTHPSVVYVEEGWNGYKYWMAFTPYANENSAYENPSIICSNDKINWIVPPGLVNPIEPAPTNGTYLADTELVLGYDNKLYCYFRAFLGTTAYMMVKSSVNGISWSAKITACTETAASGQGLISPCVVKENNGYTLYEIEGYSGVRKIYKRFSLNAENFDGVPRELCTYEGIPEGFAPWHLWVVVVEGFKYVLLNTTEIVDTGKGGDLIFGLIDKNHFKFNSYPVLTPEMAWNTKRLYRSSMIVKEFTSNGIVWDLFYSGVDVANKWRIGYTTVNSYYKDYVPDLIDEKNGDFTLSLNEIGKTTTNTNKLNQIISIPKNSTVNLPIGYSFKNIVTYPNRTSFINSSGVSVFTPKNRTNKSHADGGTVSLTKTDTDTWFLSGDLEVDNVISNFPTSGLIANWKLNETSGDVIDSWKGNNGTNVGATRGVAGILGNCYSFNGSTNRIFFTSRPDFSFTNGRTDVAFTIRVLVKFNSNGNQVLITKGGAQYREYIALYEDGSMVFRLTGQGNPSINIAINYPIVHTLGVWYEYIFGYDGSGLSSGLKMYVNGVSVGSVTAQGSYLRMYPGIADLEFGKYEGVTTYSLNGFLDDISIWKGVLLDQSQINYLYNGGVPKEL